MLELREVVLKPGADPIAHTFTGGCITVVLGRNHSGKTILCRTLAGLSEPAAGGVYLEGKTLAGIDPGRRPVSLVYQAFVNYPDWTVFANIASPMVAARTAEKIIDQEVRDIADRLGLATLLDRYPAELSGGQQQRLAIGRALAKKARLLVMDEPLVNLDFKLRESLQLELAELLHDLDLAVVYTSSDPRDAFSLGDELILLADHGVLQSGRPLDVYQAPVSAAAADLMCDPRANRLPGRNSLIRPEHLSLSAHAGDDLSFAVEVIGCETNGSETFVHCRPDGLAADDHWVARLEGLVRLAPGSRQVLHAPADDVLHFVNDGGDRAPEPEAGVHG